VIHYAKKHRVVAIFSLGMAKSWRHRASKYPDWRVRSRIRIIGTHACAVRTVTLFSDPGEYHIYIYIYIYTIYIEFNNSTSSHRSDRIEWVVNELCWLFDILVCLSRTPIYGSIGSESDISRGRTFTHVFLQHRISLPIGKCRQSTSIHSSLHPCRRTSE